jgi:N-acetyl-anhydromuramyl-L-alanine amidase AmpD
VINSQLLKPHEILHSQNSASLVARRAGIMVHFDDSSEDGWAVKWFEDPACKVSYNRLYLDNGDVASIADDDRRAYHAGDCLTPLANSVFYGLSAATNTKVPVTKAQLNSIVEECCRIFRFEKWPASSIEKRIVGHDGQAIFTKRNTKNSKLWGKLGRKIDPTGLHPEKPILSVSGVRIAVALALR